MGKSWRKNSDSHFSSPHKQPTVGALNVSGGGYPQTDIGKAGVMVKGRWPSDTKTKRYMNIKGAGAATKGKRFMVSRGD